MATSAVSPQTAATGSVEAAVATIVVDGEEYLTGEDAAHALGVKPATLYAYVSRGILKPYRQGTKRRRLYRRATRELVEHRRPWPRERVLRLQRRRDGRTGRPMPGEQLA